ncbi:MAG: type III secretion system export apparatus subunit SctV [Sandaracinus sp.]
MERTSNRRYADAALAAVVLLVVGMMIVPLPTPLLDVLITANMSVGVLLLLVALYVPDGLSFTSFPTLLLVTTLYRLALNVSSTRLILLQANAGEVITAFGGFVVRGNYVVGAVVFLILTLIQFLVIAKGSERVAEVGARFTLDAMPGKQMAIDAELRTGAIGQDEARRRRRLLQRESQFYGAMDGAMKFVKGDAIAGIVITVVNIVGGLAIGVLMRDMSAVESLRLYGLLTIGDGLVSQIPSLLISTAAGLVVTRVASEDEDASLGGEVGRQIFGNPRALAIAALFLVILGAIPGLPTVPFFVLAAVFGGLAWRLWRQAAPADADAQGALRPEAQREQRAKKQLVPLVVPLSVELGPELAAELLDARGGGPFLEEELPRLRDALFLSLGVTVPGVRARQAPIGPRDYVIAMQEIPVAHGSVPPGLFVPSPPSALASLGVAVTPSPDPSTGREASVIAASDRAIAEAAGLAPLGAPAVVGRHVEDVVRRRAHELVGLQETQSMLDQLERAYPALVRNVVPKPVALPLLADILRRLVEEGVSIRPLREILEALAIHAAVEKDPVALTEAVRGALRRPITHRHVRGGAVAVHLLDPMLEDAVRDAIQRTATGSYLALPPDLARDIVSAVSRTLSSVPHPIVLTQSDVRRFVRRLLENELPQVAVLSYQELDPTVTVQPLGRIGLKG